MTVKVAVLRLLLLKMRDVMVTAEVTVIEAPARTMAVSPFVGTMPLDQLEVLFQVPPDAVVILVAPRLANAPINVSRTASVMGNLFKFVRTIVVLQFSRAFQSRS